MENKFTIVGPDGVEIECDVLFTFENPDTGKSYIIYTDNTLDEDGNTVVLASVFDPTGKNPALMPIETEEEWDMIDSVFEDLQSQMEDGDLGGE